MQDEDAVREVVKRVQDGWNANDSEAFAAPFAEDADYVLVNGRHVKGRTSIAVGASKDFSTIFKGSECAFSVEDLRFIRPGVALAHIRQILKYNAGEGEQTSEARSTWVLTRQVGEWKVAAFQNTIVTTPTG